MEPNTLQPKLSTDNLRIVARIILSVYAPEGVFYKSLDMTNPFKSMVMQSILTKGLSVPEIDILSDLVHEEYTQMFPNMVAVTRYFTFGSNHLFGLSCYAKVTAKSENRCREIMNVLFNRRWAFEYDETQMQENFDKHVMKCATAISDTELGLLIKNLENPNIPPNGLRIRTDVI